MKRRIAAMRPREKTFTEHVSRALRINAEKLRENLMGHNALFDRMMKRKV